MKGILIAVALMIVLGFVLGFLVSLISSKFKVEEDTRLTDIVNMLPGANCGGCGSPGCQAFGDKLFNKEATVSGCKVIKGEAKEKLEAYIKEKM